MNPPSQLVMGRVFSVAFVFVLVASACVGATGQETIAPAVFADEEPQNSGILEGYQTNGLDTLIREDDALEGGGPTESSEATMAPEEVAIWSEREQQAQDYVAEFLRALSEHDYELASAFVNNGDTDYLPGINRESDGSQWGMDLLLGRYCGKAMCDTPFEVLGFTQSLPSGGEVRVRFSGWGGSVEATINVGWWEGVPSVTSLPPPQPVRPSAMSLIWTVIGVGLGDVLNVRNQPDPNATIVGQLAPWSTQFAATTTVEENSHGRWRLVELPDGEHGWVNGRFLVAQPLQLDEESETRMVESADSLVTWVLGGTGEPLLSEGALWVAGIGVYADAPTPWTWVPASSLTQRSGWEERRMFDVGFDDCGADCNRSLRQFLRFDLLGPDATTLVDDIARAGMSDGVMWFAPDELHRVVIDKRADGDTYDWQRIHFVFDWSSGKQRLALIHTHGWTP